MAIHSNGRRAQLRTRTTLFMAAGAAALCGCSGQDSYDSSRDLESESLAPQAPLMFDGREAEFQRQVATSLSEEERVAVENTLRESGMDVSKMAFAGQMVAWGDVYLDVEPVLRQWRRGQGRTLGVPDSTLSMDDLPIDPRLYSGEFNGNFLFHRPDINGVKIVVPNGNATSFLVSAFQHAVNTVVGAADDCLTFISVLTQSQYDNLSEDDKILSKPIFVHYGDRPTVCPANEDATVACALYPREESREFDINLSATRMVPGPRIGVNSAIVTSDDPRTSALTHELLHALGLAHSNGGFITNVVPDSSCSSNESSIMRDGGASTTITEDDRATIDTLFSPLPGANCGYSRGLKILGQKVPPC